MRYIAAEDVAKAKEMDLLTYLRNYEPQELVHVSGNTYCTREHDSLRISNGKWCWFSRGIGGRSALDYLIKVKGIPFTQAAEIILGREAEKPPVFYRQKERKHTELLMPELSETTEQVEKYLYIGHGTASAAVWSGAPASSAGVRTNAAISTPVSFPSSPAVSTVSNGSGSVGSGRITPWSPRPA